MESLGPVLLLFSVAINTLENEDAKFLSETSTKMIFANGENNCVQ